MQKKCNFIDAFRVDLLSWYDKNHRSLPWRSQSAAHENPYHVWLSEIMLQQTTVPTVIPYFLKFIDLWPSVEDLAAANNDDVMREWAGLGYYARARNLHKCAKAVTEEYGGKFPQDAQELKKLPGIGDYTSAAIASIAFDKPATVVDGNVDRIMARLFKIETPFPKGKTDVRGYAETLSGARTDRPSAYAQALMDLGSMVCTPRTPKCGVCPISKYCTAYKTGTVELYPKKAPKKKKPRRYGHIYIVTDTKGRLLLEKRPDKGLLGGMTGLPTHEWCETEDIAFAPPVEAEEGAWLRLNEKAYHVFTHFELEMTVYTAKIDDLLSISLNSNYIIENIDEADRIGLPTVFKKPYLLAKKTL